MPKYTEFYKYVDSKINAKPGIAGLIKKQQQLASGYWEAHKKLENRKKELRKLLLHDKSKRAKLKKQFDLERALEVLKRSTQK